MASYRVLSWRDIPAQVTATDGSASVSRLLPGSFQQEIDRVAMAEGIVGEDEYLEAWSWSPEHEREGTAEQVAEALAQELAEEWHRRHQRPQPHPSPAPAGSDG